MERIVFLTCSQSTRNAGGLQRLHTGGIGRSHRQVPKHVTREPHGSVLLLADFSRSVFNKETVEHLKLAAVFDRPHLKRSAWVLTENLDKTLYESIRSFSGREIPTFRTRDEALEYLLEDKPSEHWQPDTDK